MKKLLKKLCSIILFFILTIDPIHAESMIDLFQEKKISQKLNTYIQVLNKKRATSTKEKLLSTIEKNAQKNMAFLKQNKLMAPEILAMIELEVEKQLTLYAQVDLETLIDLKIAGLEQFQSTSRIFYPFYLTRTMLNFCCYPNASVGEYLLSALLMPLYLAYDLLALLPGLVYEFVH